MTDTNTSQDFPNRTSKKILIVEDEVVVGIDLQKSLQSLGYTVSDVIRYGEQVEEAIIQEQPDLLLLDIKLKGEMTGIEAGRQATAKYNLPIIFLTAFSDDNVVAEAKTATPYGFLKKPVNLENLRLTIEMALNQSQMEEKLRQSEARLNLIVEGAALGTWDYYIDTGEVIFNEQWAAILGYKMDELDPTIDVWLKMIHPDDVSHVTKAVENHFAGITPFYSTEHRLLAKSGEWKWVLDSGKVTSRDHDGTPLRMSGVHQDINDRKQFEQRLKNNELNLSNFFNLGTDFNWVLDEQGNILAINEVVTKRLGYTEGELIGKPIFHVHPPAQRTEAGLIIQDMLQNKKEFCPIPLLTKKDVQIPVETYVSRGDWNGQKAFFGVSKDISKLKLSEEKFSSAFHNSPAIVGLSDIETGQYIEVNQSFLNRLGFAEEEIIGHTAYELGIIEPSVRNKLAKRLQEEGKLYNQEITLQTRNGEQLHGLLSAELIDIQGILYNLSTIVDITKRKQAEQKIERNERFLNDVLNSVQDGINVLDSDLNIIKVNRALERQYAHHMPMIGKKCYEVFQSRTSICPWCPSVEALESGQVTSIEVELPVPKDTPGTIRWIELYAYPLIENEQVTGIIEYSRDITAKKCAEIKVRHAHKQLRDILNSIDANVYVATMDNYEILFMNQHMIDEFGQDLTGQTCWDVLRQQNQPCQDCTNSRLLDSDGSFALPQIWECYIDATEKHYLMHDRAIHWYDGRIVRLQVATDISKIRQMEEKLRHKHKMEAIGVMAGGIAHNFNNNLGVILGNLELVQMEFQDEHAANKYIDAAMEAIRRSSALVQQILIYNNTSFITSKTEVIRLDDLVEDSLKLITPSLPQSLTFHWNKILQTEPVYINVARDQFQEILINLCSNAVTAMDGSGQLTIATSLVNINDNDIPPRFTCTPGSYALITVQDNGCGMDTKTLQQIFNPFFSTRELCDATGMGLSTVEGLVIKQHGFITVRSTPDRGSTFDVYIPMAANHLRENKKSRFDKYLGGTESILFVDDDRPIAELHARLLSKLGYTVSTQISSSIALDVFKAKPEDFDLVITDQMMPELTGMELIAELQHIQPEVRTILYTGYSQMVSKEKIKQLGINAFLVKPLDLGELTKVIRKLLDD